MAQLAVLHGPNLNLLGKREPCLYGDRDLQSINEDLQRLADKLQHTLLIKQSNSESELIEYIHQKRMDFLIFNPAAYTHTSVALRDAILARNIPFVEIHVSNIFSREDFRRHSYFSDIAKGMISGCGTLGYELALQFADHYLKISKS